MSSTFSAGEPDFPTPDNIKQAAIRAHRSQLHQVHSSRRHRRDQGKPFVFRHKTEFGTDYKPLGMQSSRSAASTSLFNYTQAILNPGDEVIIPVPYWVTYKDIVN